MQRLKTPAQFKAVMAGGRTIARTEHFALHRVPLGPDPRPAAAEGAPTGPEPPRSPALFAVRQEPWLGVIVPKRWARRAVTRNAIKRQIYTVSQDFEADLPAAAHVVRLRAGFDRAEFRSPSSAVLKQAVRAELLRLFSEATR
ncbi:ribonuclease P protein component [Ramlibacter tataouinensis]|uniref:ribonuclease P protein component n=1 Tax=Ramlibacter tataouinensis TaxID=94132 RepID=UPI0022F3F6C4|nr:ribonuclease P protein component [Ramlibacter tataouinensis]WBY00053.1 ribonuclease P protein component [Ramlibacter tataouinensis]